MLDQDPQDAAQIMAAAKASFLQGDQWAYAAGILAILLGGLLIALAFPGRDDERRLLARYHAEDTGQPATARETAERAGISPQYLSEIERGRKEPSSELLASFCEALDVALPDLLAEVISEMTRDEQLEFVGRNETLVPIGQRHTDLRLAPVRTGAPLGGNRPGAPVASAA